MKRIMHTGLLIVLVLSLASFVSPAFASTAGTAPGASTAITAQTYTVMVGSENTSIGVSLMSFFPQVVKIHVGDTVTWNINSHEIHTVTFLAGEPLPELLIPSNLVNPPSPLQINPLAAFPVIPNGGQYDGSSYANSGIMSTDPGFATTFSLTFTNEGSFDYVCIVHGQMMSGTIDVVSSDTPVPTPAQEQAQGQAEMKASWIKVPPVLAKARAQIVPPVKNPDGTFTRTVTVGYESGNIMVMGFFPNRMTVFPGDTVVWKFSATNSAPHTISFFNGNPDQPLAFPYEGELLINPAVLFPSEAVMNGTPLNRTDFFNSGILTPPDHTSFSLKIGDISGMINYECILHDTSGMDASLFVVPRMSTVQ
jgi:plastocyanin